MIAARMLTRFIWNAETTVKNAARRVSPVWFSSTRAAAAGKVWKWSGRFDVVDRLPQRLPRGMPHRLHVPRARQLHAAQAELGDPVDFLHRRVDVAVGQAGQADEAVGIVAAEVHEPVVVDAEHLVRGLGVVQPRGRAEDAVDDLGLHAVAVHVLRAQHRIGRTGDPLLAVLVETGRGHHVHAVVLAGHVLGAGRPHAAPQAEARPVLGGPVRTVGTVVDVGHAVLERRRRVRREQIGRDPGQVDVAVGGDPLVAHDASPWSVNRSPYACGQSLATGPTRMSLSDFGL